MSRLNFKEGVVFVLLVFVLLITGRIAAYADEGGFTITDYDVHMELHENDTVSVTETITVDFSEERHGIYRDIPLRIVVGGAVFGITDSKSYETYVRDVSVEGAEYTCEQSDTLYTIRIGNEDEMVKGEQVYKISYTYVYPEDEMEQADFLFHSPLGAQWDTTIARFSFDMRFEKAFPDEALEQLQVFSGEYGQEENALPVEYELSAQGISGEAYGIGANQAVTIFCRLPDGYFVGAYEREKNSITVFYVCCACFAAVSLVLFFFALKPDFRKVVETVEYYPPEGISSAEMGTIMDDAVDDRDMISLIPLWASQGYLTIEEETTENKKWTRILLHKKKPLPGDAPLYQSKLFNAIFAASKVVDLDDLPNSFGMNYMVSKEALRELYTGERALSKGWTLARILMALEYIAMFAVVTTSYIYDKEGYILAAGVVLPLLVPGFQFLVSKKGKGLGLSKKRKIVMWVFNVIAILFSMMFAVMSFEECWVKDDILLLMWLVTVAASLLCARIVRPSDYRLSLLGKLRGFRTYIKTAELPRLQMQLEENPEYFYDILPYAMAFGLVDEWNKRFEGLTISKPDWYYGTALVGETVWSVRTFSRHMSDRMRRPVEYAVSVEEAKAASSSIGGGFSGGGGGGGGGGSW